MRSSTWRRNNGSSYTCKQDCTFYPEIFVLGVCGDNRKKQTVFLVYTSQPSLLTALLFPPKMFLFLSFFFYKTKLLRRLRICHAIFKNFLFASNGIIHLYQVVTGLGHFRCSVRPVYKQKWSEPKLAILTHHWTWTHKKGLKWFILCHTRIHKHSGLYQTALFPQTLPSCPLLYELMHLLQGLSEWLEWSVEL